MQLWNNNKNDGEASRTKEEYDSFLKDEEVIKAANHYKMGMLLTGVRKFYH